MRQRFDQIAYVTNDMAKAVEILSYRYGWSDFDLRRLVIPAEVGGACADVELSVGKAQAAGLFIEIIQAHSDIEGFFTATLPKTGEFGLRFHHTGILIEGDLSEWDAHFDHFKSQGRVYLTADLGAMRKDVRFFFADERSSLGHYVEYAWIREPAERVIERLGTHIPTGTP